MKQFSMFSGVEGIGQGLPNDWELVGQSEIDKYASMVLKYHYPDVKNYGDCTAINYEEVPDFDILTGGSPCQDFSIAGKRKGLRGSRSSLAWEYIRALREKQPRYFIWENVEGVMSSRSGWDFANLLCAFSESGYHLWWQVLNAKDFGVPQSRTRIFVVGFRKGSPPEVFFEPKGTRQNLKELTSEASQGYRVYDPSGIATTLASQAGGVGAKTGLYAIPVLTPDRIEKRQNGRRFKTDGEPMFTLNTQDKHGVYDGNSIRKLTPLECERLMSWPDDWTRWGINEKGEKVEISDNQRYKMCGNGVVSNVIKEIVKNLL